MPNMRCIIRHHSSIVTQHIKYLLECCGAEVLDNTDNLAECDIVFIDDMQADTVSAHIKEQIIVIICLSSTANEQDIALYLSRDFHDVLLLPCDKEALASKLEQWHVP